MHREISIAGAIVLALAAAPAAAAPLPLSKDVAFFESLRQKAQISGASVVGLLSRGGAASTSAPLQAAIPASWGGGEVCARLVSSDGLYEARGQYSVPAGWPGGVAEFDFPTTHGAVLAYPAETMAVLVARGECTADSPVLALAAWRSIPDDTAVVLVNSYRADETYLIFPDSGLDVDCTPNPDPQRTAFDMVCTVPAEVLASGGSVGIEVNRVRGGGVAAPDLVTVELP